LLSNYSRLNSQSITPPTKASHSPGVKIRTGPSGSDRRGVLRAQYLMAPPAIRRQINQGLFVKLYINQDGTVGRAELTEPFAALLADGHTLGLHTETASLTTQDVSGARTIHRTTMAARTWPSQAFLTRTGERRSTKMPQLILLGRGVKDDGVVRVGTVVQSSPALFGRPTRRSGRVIRSQ
jgi:hypothetical protein